jgi:hypothetical protein
VGPRQHPQYREFPGPEEGLKTSLGVRRVDDVLTPNGIAIEVKTGRVGMSPSIYRQILNDAELVRRTDNSVVSAEWVFMPSPVTGEVGPKNSVAMLLQEYNTEYRLSSDGG